MTQRTIDYILVDIRSVIRLHEFLKGFFIYYFDFYTHIFIHRKRQTT